MTEEPLKRLRLRLRAAMLASEARDQESARLPDCSGEMSGTWPLEQAAMSGVRLSSAACETSPCASTSAISVLSWPLCAAYITEVLSEAPLAAWADQTD